MSTHLVETMARAMFTADWPDDAWDDAGRRLRRRYRAKVRLALAASRQDPLGFTPQTADLQAFRMMLAAWRAVIDVALSDRALPLETAGNGTPAEVDPVAASETVAAPPQSG